MTDDHTDPLGIALSVLDAGQRRRFGEITSALVEAADAAAAAPGWTPRPAADALRALAVHYRAASDPLWPALNAAAARADEIGGAVTWTTTTP